MSSSALQPEAALMTMDLMLACCRAPMTRTGYWQIKLDDIQVPGTTAAIPICQGGCQGPSHLFAGWACG